MSIYHDLFDQIIATARRAGLDQNQLAAAAGIAPKEFFRAKKRGKFDLETLQALAAVVGLSLTLTPTAVQKAARPTFSPSKLPSTPCISLLAHPSRGLAWSNPNTSVEALVRNALKNGSFYLLLDASFEHGLPFVQQQWALMKCDVDVRMSQQAQAEIDRKLANIERGMRLAEPDAGVCTPELGPSTRH